MIPPDSLVLMMRLTAGLLLEKEEEEEVTVAMKGAFGLTLPESPSAWEAAR